MVQGKVLPDVPRPSKYHFRGARATGYHAAASDGTEIYRKDFSGASRFLLGPPSSIFMYWLIRLAKTTTYHAHLRWRASPVEDDHSGDGHGHGASSCTTLRAGRLTACLQQHRRRTIATYPAHGKDEGDVASSSCRPRAAGQGEGQAR